jgi:hypothetical protein
VIASEGVCAAEPCLMDGRPIRKGDIYVAVHDYAPRKDASGRVRTDLKHNHFTVRYHIACFRYAYRTDKGSGYNLEGLAGYDTHRDQVQRELAEYKQTRR